MREAGTNTVAALESAQDTGIVPRSFFWAIAKDRSTGDPVELGYWTGDYTITVEVISGVTGENEERTYVGGVNLEIGDIPRVSDLTIQTVDVSMSAIPDDTQDLVRTYDCRLAKVEIHSCLLDPETREILDPPDIDFLGEIDGSPIETGAAGGESMISLSVRSDAIGMLTRINPRKRSDEGQKRRSGDKFAQYANSVRTWQIPWGMETQK